MDCGVPEQLLQLQTVTPTVEGGEVPQVLHPGCCQALQHLIMLYFPVHVSTHYYSPWLYFYLYSFCIYISNIANILILIFPLTYLTIVFIWWSLYIAIFFISFMPCSIIYVMVTYFCNIIHIMVTYFCNIIYVMVTYFCNITYIMVTLHYNTFYIMPLFLSSVLVFAHCLIAGWLFSCLLCRF